jgi:hypothetical protein
MSEELTLGGQPSLVFGPGPDEDVRKSNYGNINKTKRAECS